LASDHLGSRETEDCANPGDRVDVHQSRATEISDTASSFQRHLEDNFSPTPSRIDKIVGAQRLVLEALVLDTLVKTVSAVTVEAQATANPLPDTIDEGTRASCSETWEGKSGMMEREKYLFIFIIDTALQTVL
jgi:hypothetical protein